VDSIAVVGGGIAGVAAAWSLHRSGHEVTLLEKDAELGGNARTFRWALTEGHADSPVLVIAWPGQYYHNYHALLAELGVERTTLPITYYVQHPDGVFCQDGRSDLDRRFERDFERWHRLIRWTGRVNDFFLAGKRPRSMYDFSYWNPLNLIPLYRLARLLGISDAFWHQVFVPVHCATLITTSMKDLPAVVAPLVESIVPLDRPCEMSTWVGAPRQVFDRMTEGFAEGVHTGCEVVSVRREGSGFALSSASGETFRADRVVFACQASAVLGALEDATRLERLLLSRVRYVDDVDPTFSRFRIHSDTSILPEKDRDRILSGFNTYVEVDEAGRLECTFVLSAGNPNLRDLGRPMLVTFHSRKPIRDVEADVALRHPNPVLSARNLMNVLLLRHIQGRRGIHYCGSYTTPEGAHDLSLLSGLVVARDIGAAYPFEAAGGGALADYHQMQRIMLGRVLPDRPPRS
jgi:predicted NAD/FAD-binding protein